MEDGGAQEVESGGSYGVEVLELGGGERGEGRLGDLDAGDLGEVRGESAGEEAYSGVEVECESAGAVVGDVREEFREEEAVGLEEGPARNPVRGCWLLVVGCW
jgi:hypothetical protein